MSWWRFIRTSKQPELPVVLLEDIGAEIGLLFALFGVMLAHSTGDAALGRRRLGRDRLPARRSIAIVLAVEMKGLLIGESAHRGRHRRDRRRDRRRAARRAA